MSLWKGFFFIAESPLVPFTLRGSKYSYFDPPVLSRTDIGPWLLVHRGVSPKRVHNPNEKNAAEDGHYKAGQIKAGYTLASQERKQPTAQNRAEYSDYYVSNHTPVAAGNKGSNPSGNTAEDYPKENRFHHVVFSFLVNCHNPPLFMVEEISTLLMPYATLQPFLTYYNRLNFIHIPYQ
jgi:hypothetical protein